MAEKRNRGFDPAALKAAIAQCDKNIETFEAAIAREQATKADYRRMLRDLEDRAANPPQVHVEVVRED